MTKLLCARSRTAEFSMMTPAVAPISITSFHPCYEVRMIYPLTIFSWCQEYCLDTYMALKTDIWLIFAPCNILNFIHLSFISVKGLHSYAYLPPEISILQDCLLLRKADHCKLIEKTNTLRGFVTVVWWWTTWIKGQFSRINHQQGQHPLITACHKMIKSWEPNFIRVLCSSLHSKFTWELCSPFSTAVWRLSSATSLVCHSQTGAGNMPPK